MDDSCPYDISFTIREFLAGEGKTVESVSADETNTPNVVLD